MSYGQTEIDVLSDWARLVNFMNLCFIELYCIERDLETDVALLYHLSMGQERYD